MTNKKLSKNFSLSEFTKSDVTDYQLSLLKILAEEMQKVRDRLQDYKSGKKAVSITVCSGVRTQADYERIKKNGSNPSKTSDHFCGLQLLCKPTMGAADIHVNNCRLSLLEVAKLIKKMDKSGECHFGQVIYEENPKTKSAWIHLGNDWKQIFTDRVAVSRKKYLISKDNGVTFKVLK